MNNGKPWKAVSGQIGNPNPWFAGEGMKEIAVARTERENEMQLIAIRRIVIPITYIRINALFEKILRRHC